MWRILQQDVPEDYVITAGVTTYRDCCMAFAEVGVTLTFERRTRRMKRLPLLLALINYIRFRWVQLYWVGVYY
jgi:GDP-D-mannose dehydratase